MNYEVIVFAFVVLFWIVRGIFRFFKWAGKQMTGGVAGANPIQRAIADAQQQSQAPPPTQAAPLSQPPLTRPSARPMPRQPQAGGPAVGREATERDFRRQEEELIAWEPAALGAPLQSVVPTVTPGKTLFGNTDDLVRAIILREALGPPLSRRRPPP